MGTNSDEFPVPPLFEKFEHEFTCPVCVPIVLIQRHTIIAFDMAVGAHIRMHEDKGSQRGVDRARVQCTNPSCEIGTQKVWNPKTSEFEYRLTEFDQKFLNDLLVKW